MTKLRPFFATLALGLVFSLPVLAAEGEGKAGLPQLDTSLFPSQLFWLAVSFGLLYLLMTKWTVPAVQRAQGKRRQRIEGDLAAAAKANEAAKATLAHYEKALADARAEAQKTLADFAAQTTRETGAKQAARQQDLARRVAEAEAKIAAERDAALKEVQGIASELASAIVEQVTGKAANGRRS